MGGGQRPGSGGGCSVVICGARLCSVVRCGKIQYSTLQLSTATFAIIVNSVAVLIQLLPLFLFQI